MGRKALALDALAAEMQVARGLESRRTAINNSILEIIKACGRLEKAKSNKHRGTLLDRIGVLLGELRLLLAVLEQRKALATDLQRRLLQALIDLEALVEERLVTTDAPGDVQPAAAASPDLRVAKNEEHTATTMGAGSTAPVPTTTHALARASGVAEALEQKSRRATNKQPKTKTRRAQC